MIHEFGHVMAFISFLKYHKHYTVFDKSVKSWMWTGPQTRKRAETYYGCNSDQMKGIALQTMGGNVPGAHWSEDTMNDELMTPFSGEEPEKVSPMMLGLVEDTKWYKANYRMVETYDYKKGNVDGCKQDKHLCAKDRACKVGTSGEITSDFKGVGYCEKDDKGCPREVKYGNRDVTKPAGWGNNYFKYGARFSANTIVSLGNLLYWNSDGTSYNTVQIIPVEAFCNADFTKYTLRFHNYKLNVSSDQSSFSHNGDVMVSCNSQNAGQSVKFNCFQSYCSTIKCADPAKMCPKRFSKVGALNKNHSKCDYSCLKNGRCHPGGTPNTNNRRLKDTTQNMFASYKRRFLQSWDDWGDFNQEETNTPQNQQEAPSNQPAADSSNAQQNDESTDNAQKQQMAQNDKKAVYKRTVASDIAEHINYSGNWKCWCYNDEKEHNSCSPLVEDDDGSN